MSVNLFKMSVTLQDKINNKLSDVLTSDSKLSDMLTSDDNYDLIEAAAEILNDKLYSIAYQTYKQLDLRGEMSDADYSLIRKRIIKELYED